MAEHYDFAAIEAKWQRYWADKNIPSVRPDDPRPKYYVLCMYPYPSGTLHMGHVINYTIGDAVVRQKMMQGFAVLSPMGWDSFGLPAENAAIKSGTPPRQYTAENIDKMREQFKRAGWAYDWSREFASHNPGYYRWTQWLFLRFYQAGLAFKKKAPVNWCPSCSTVLANEQVVDAKCERCSSPVEQRDLEQWFFKMSAYAQRLLDGIERLRGNWPDDVLKKQTNWIGRSEGARLDFQVEGSDKSIGVFTTRPDTTFGVTFMSLAPEHPLVPELVKGTPHEAEVMSAARRMRNQSQIERTNERTEKEGVFTGRYCINPFTGERVQIWVANFALMNYGTGAVMSVPAHDQRDFLFARKYGLPVKLVIQPKDQPLDAATMTAAWTEGGTMVNSGRFDGQDNEAAKKAMTQAAKDGGFGDFTVNFRLRDWLLSRQRYWGTPIPIVYCRACGEQPVPEDQLPVRLPDNVEFKPTGESPLARCPEFVNTTCPKCGGPAKRDTDTMDTFVDSSWYFLRFASPRDEKAPFDPEAVRRFLPVDQYVGGSEHSTMHLIYARFFTKVLHDLGHLPFDEPFTRLFCQGMVCANAYHADYFQPPEGGAALKPTDVAEVKTDDGEIYVRKADRKPVQLRRVWLRPEDVAATVDGKTLRADDLRGDMKPTAFVRAEDAWPVEQIMSKMSKSKLNGVSPDELFREYGADTVHAYMLFEGPANEDLYYSEDRIKGAQGFLKDLFKVVTRDAGGLPPLSPGGRGNGGEGAIPADLSREEKELRTAVHQTIQRVDQAYQGAFNFNTGIARMMELLRKEYARAAGLPADTVRPAVRREALETLVKLIAPIAPHLGEELWEKLGHAPSVFDSGWPKADEAAARAEEVEIPVQVNGKVRGKVRVARDLPEAELQRIALEAVADSLGGKTVRKVVVVPNRMVNAVVG
jgi:leucyl-tRNA synthetase